MERKVGLGWEHLVLSNTSWRFRIFWGILRYDWGIHYLLWSHRMSSILVPQSFVIFLCHSISIVNIAKSWVRLRTCRTCKRSLYWKKCFRIRSFNQSYGLSEWHPFTLDDHQAIMDDIAWPKSKLWMPPLNLWMPKNFMNGPWIFFLLYDFTNCLHRVAHILFWQ